MPRARSLSSPQTMRAPQRCEIALCVQRARPRHSLRDPQAPLRQSRVLHTQLARRRARRVARVDPRAR
eukprot:6078271-Prymnesium_polylepis.1